jgi:hypothetical protein
MSSSPGQVLPASAFTYSVSLRARHPHLDLAVITETLHLEPAYSWTAGEPRRAPGGGTVGGQHRDSYWAAPLAGQVVGDTSIPFEGFLMQQLVQLARHRELFTHLSEDGGEVSLLIEISPVAQASVTINMGIIRKLAELNIQIEMQFVGD